MDLWSRMLSGIADTILPKALEENALLLQMEETLREEKELWRARQNFLAPIVARSFQNKWRSAAPPPDVPVLVRLAHHNGNLAAGAQGDIPHQRAPVLDVPAVAVGAEIVVHPVQQRRVIGRVPVVHLLSDVQVLVPRQRRGVVPVVRDQADVLINGAYCHACPSRLSRRTASRPRK